MEKGGANSLRLSSLLSPLSCSIAAERQWRRPPGLETGITLGNVRRLGTGVEDLRWESCGKRGCSRHPAMNSVLGGIIQIRAAMAPITAQVGHDTPVDVPKIVGRPIFIVRTLPTTHHPIPFPVAVYGSGHWLASRQLPPKPVAR